MSTALDQPARKLFLCHLQYCTVCSPQKSAAPEEKPVKNWSAYCNGKTVQFSTVSTQGVVIEVNKT